MFLDVPYGAVLPPSQMVSFFCNSFVESDLTLLWELFPTAKGLREQDVDFLKGKLFIMFNRLLPPMYHSNVTFQYRHQIYGILRYKNVA